MKPKRVYLVQEAPESSELERLCGKEDELKTAPAKISLTLKSRPYSVLLQSSSGGHPLKLVQRTSATFSISAGACKRSSSGLTTFDLEGEVANDLEYSWIRLRSGTKIKIHLVFFPGPVGGQRLQLGTVRVLT